LTHSRQPETVWSCFGFRARLFVRKPCNQNQDGVNITPREKNQGYELKTQKTFAVAAKA